MFTHELIKRWLSGPPVWEMTLCERDARVGGKFHMAWRGPEGAEIVDARHVPRGRRAGAHGPHGIVRVRLRRAGGRATRNARPGRARWQNLPHGYGALILGGRPRLDDFLGLLG